MKTLRNWNHLAILKETQEKIDNGRFEKKLFSNFKQVLSYKTDNSFNYESNYDGIISMKGYRSIVGDKDYDGIEKQQYFLKHPSLFNWKESEIKNSLLDFDEESKASIFKPREDYMKGVLKKTWYKVKIYTSLAYLGQFMFIVNLLVT